MRPGEPPRYAELLERLGPLDPFGDPAAYDLAYGERSEDVAFYLGLAVERAERGPVLEVGCGNGRILLPIARAGVEAWGIDRSAPLVDDLRRRLRDEPGLRAAVRRADLRTFRLGRRFDQVFCTFNTFLHLYTRADVERFLKRARAHLAPGGRLVLDTLVPRAADLARNPQRWARSRAYRDAEGRRWTHRERFAYEPLEQVLYVTTERAEVGGDEVQTTLLAHRQFFPAELEALLHYNQFRVDQVWAEFRREEPELDADVLIWVCSPR